MNSHPTEYLFWFAAVKHSTIPEYVQKLEQYLDVSAAYIIGKEIAKGVHHTTNGEHIHVAAQITKETYKKFHLNYHVGKLKLLMKTKDGIAKQNGLVKTVRNETRFLAYTCKDNNIIYKNIDLKTIQDYIEVSFPKTETWENDIIDFVKLHFEPSLITNTDTVIGVNPCYNITNMLETMVVQYYITNSKKKCVPVKNTIRKIVLRYLMYEIPECRGDRLTHLICNYIL